MMVGRSEPVPRDQEGWFTRERVLTITLGMATLLGLYVCYLIARPFVAPMAFALALAVATHRPYLWLRARIKSDAVAAGVTVVLVAILIIGPVVALGIYLVQELNDNLDQHSKGQGLSNWRAIVEQQPQLARILHWAETRFDLQSQFTRIGSMVAAQATAFLRGSVNLITQLGITLFVLFFLYRDESIARSALWRLMPLSQTEAAHLFARVASTMQATVNGSLTVAAVQAVLASLMYWALGVATPAIWGALTFIAALVPVFGTVLVWGPIALYLAFSGSLVKALILLGWGMVAIASIDNVLYPFLVGDRLRLHTVPTFFSIVGGLALFGPAGLILGPMALAITMALLDVWWERTQHGQAAEEAVSPTAESPVPPGAAVEEVGNHRDRD